MDISDHFKSMETFNKMDRERTRKRKEEWKKQLPSKLTDQDPETGRLGGLWKVDGGVLFIESNFKGEFDPAKGQFFDSTFIDNLWETLHEGEGND